MSQENPVEKFDWIQLKHEMDEMRPETYYEKFNRKIRENPLVPVGCLMTTVALSYGLWCMRTGDRKRSQLMMRFRIAAQGLTIAAVLGGIIISAGKANKK